MIPTGYFQLQLPRPLPTLMKMAPPKTNRDEASSNSSSKFRLPFCYFAMTVIWATYPGITARSPGKSIQKKMFIIGTVQKYSISVSHWKIFPASILKNTALATGSHIWAVLLPRQPVASGQEVDLPQPPPLEISWLATQLSSFLPVLKIFNS